MKVIMDWIATLALLAKRRRLITSLIVHLRSHRLIATCSMFFALLLSGCGGDNSTASAPAPVIVNAAGTWVGPFRITALTGGECGVKCPGFVGGQLV